MNNIVFDSERIRNAFDFGTCTSRIAVQQRHMRASVQEFSLLAYTEYRCVWRLSSNILILDPMDTRKVVDWGVNGYM